MRSKSAYLWLLAIMAILIILSFAFNIVMIKDIFFGTIKNLGNTWILALSAASAFVFTGNRYYWLINIACAVIVAVVLNIFVLGAAVTLISVLYKSLAFLLVVYALNLVKLLITK